MLSIIITARERYGLTRPSVLSVLEGLDNSVEVIVVTGNAPAAVAAFLEAKAKSRRNFHFIGESRNLWPNEARVIGLARARKGNDLVFIENDVAPRKGCLKNLLACFRAKKADIVAPLIFEGDFSDPNPTCHIAGADLLWEGSRKTGRVAGMEHFLNHEPVDGKGLSAKRVDVVESHCFLIRRTLLDKLVLKKSHGGLFAHLDLCLQAKKFRAKIFMEPKAQVVFANPVLSPLKTRSDFDYFVFQWADRDNNQRLQELAKDWGLDAQKGLIPSFRAWVLWNKGSVFASIGTLWWIENLLWKAARKNFCPDWVRKVLEWYLTARVRYGTRWGTEAA